MLYPWLLPWFSLASALQGGVEVAQGLLLSTTEGLGWQQFRFTSDFPDVPVVVVLPSLEDLADPATVRIRNVTMKGFQASIAEPRGSDGVHADMTFSYMAASQGIWSLNGTIFEARLLDITERQAGACRPFSYPNMAWKNVAFQYSFSTEPVILTSIQTANNEQRALPTEGPSEPWLVSGVRSLTKSTVQLALDSSTAPSGSNNDLAEPRNVKGTRIRSCSAFPQASGIHRLHSPGAGSGRSSGASSEHGGTLLRQPLVHRQHLVVHLFNIP